MDEFVGRVPVCSERDRRIWITRVRKWRNIELHITLPLLSDSRQNLGNYEHKETESGPKQATQATPENLQIVRSVEKVQDLAALDFVWSIRIVWRMQLRRTTRETIELRKRLPKLSFSSSRQSLENSSCICQDWSQKNRTRHSNAIHEAEKRPGTKKDAEKLRQM